MTRTRSQGPSELFVDLSRTQAYQLRRREVILDIPYDQQDPVEIILQLIEDQLRDIVEEEQQQFELTS
mgnify:CR=1 FL=1